MKIKLLIVSLCIFFSGCTTIAKLFYGYRTPKAEDKESLLRYLEKKKIDSHNILVLSDTVSYYKRFQTIRDFPSLRAFDKNGVLVYYKDTGAACNSPAYEFSQTICNFPANRRVSKQSLDSEIKGLLTLDNQPVVIDKEKNYDYYVFIYWARMVGRLNKIEVKAWEENLKKNTGCNICIYKVDLDWQKRWGGEP
ncbi:MAG: hypothetical protein NT126_01830 [Bacteroidetes bacterium]|nr:hypothetical protein [Bacteroidota bacterium]